MNKYREKYFILLDQFDPPNNMINQFLDDSEECFNILRDYCVESDCEIELRKVSWNNPIAAKLVELS